jgi:toxin ParE1/3/4
VKRTVVFSPEARRDLEDLFDYIASRSGGRLALAYTDRIKTYCLGFGDFPERGTRRDDLRHGFRVIGFERRVAIAFHVRGDTVTIDRILYGGRDLRRVSRKNR